MISGSHWVTGHCEGGQVLQDPPGTRTKVRRAETILESQRGQAYQCRIRGNSGLQIQSLVVTGTRGHGNHEGASGHLGRGRNSSW